MSGGLTSTTASSRIGGAVVYVIIRIPSAGTMLHHEGGGRSLPGPSSIERTAAAACSRSTPWGHEVLPITAGSPCGMRLAYRATVAVVSLTHMSPQDPMPVLTCAFAMATPGERPLLARTPVATDSDISKRL